MNINVNSSVVVSNSRFSVVADSTYIPVTKTITTANSATSIYNVGSGGGSTRPTKGQIYPRNI